jgi:hypothetical protein
MAFDEPEPHQALKIVLNLSSPFANKG